MKMKKWKRLFSFGVFFFIIGIALWMTAGIYRSELVLRFGIVAYRIIRGVLVGLAVLGGILFACEIYFDAKADRERKRLAEEKNRAAAASAGSSVPTTPELIRKGLAKAQREHPTFPFDRCVLQMDRMDGFQARLHDLLTTNSLDAFAYTEDILQQAEDEMCGDIRAFLNYLIVLEDDTVAMPRYEAMLARNDTRFNYIQDLLVTLADFVSENMSQGDAAAKIKFCNEAIRETFVQGDTITAQSAAFAQNEALAQKATNAGLPF